MKLARQQCRTWGCAIIVSILVCKLVSPAVAGMQCGVTISDIRYHKVHRNWLLVPATVDLEVHWVVTTGRPADSRSQKIAAGSADLPFIYDVRAVDDSSRTGYRIRQVKSASSLIFNRVPIGRTYSIKVRALDSTGQILAESDVRRVHIGKGSPDENSLATGKELPYYVNPGRWQLALLGRTEVYDRSSLPAKLAFIFLSVVCVLGVIILTCYSSRTLYLGNVFPFRRKFASFFWSISMQCDTAYERRLTRKFKFVLKAWETIATRSKVVAGSAVKSLPASLSAKEKIASVDAAYMEYWASKGAGAIGTIEGIISFPEYHGANGMVKNPDDLFTELVIKIEDNFHDLLGHSGSLNGGANGYPKETDMPELIDEIYEPVANERGRLARLRRYIFRKGATGSKEAWRRTAATRIIRATLSIHRTNGYHWSKSNAELKRAFEDRISNAIQSLKRKSKIDLFWMCAILAPVVGLLGTITGIAVAVQELSRTSATADAANAIQFLSAGVFDALWATTLGLVNCILFIVIYYYYRHKLKWIDAKLHDIYCAITEKL